MLLGGIIALGVIAAMVTLKPGEDLVEPFVVLGFGMLCNIGYTLGWITEIFVKKSKTYGPTMFKVGLLFSLVVVSLPAIAHLINIP